MDKSIFGLLIFIAAYIAGRFISERALKLLSEKEKGRLLQGFAKYRVYSLVGIVLIVFVYFGISSALPNSFYSSMQFFIGALVLYLLVGTIYSYKKLKDLKLPDAYINQYLISTFVQYVGIFIFFAFLISRNP